MTRDQEMAAWWTAQMDAMIMKAFEGVYTNSVPGPESEPLTAGKLLEIARALGPPLPPAPRVVPVEPLCRVEVYTGHDLLTVWEDNPAYNLIPTGQVVWAEIGYLNPERVAYVRADEWRKQE